MNYSGFKEYLDLLGMDVRALANELDSPSVEVDTGCYVALKPIIFDSLGTDEYIQSFYVWLHTAARELSNDAKYAIERIDETSPHPDEVNAVKDLVHQVGILNELVNEYAQVLVQHRPWVKLTNGTVETHRIWINRAGEMVGTPEKRNMEPRNLPTKQFKIVVVEGEPGQNKAAFSCSDLMYKNDASAGNIDIAQAFVFDMSQMLVDFLMPSHRRFKGAAAPSSAHQNFAMKTLGHAARLMHGICDMAEVMHKHSILVDTDNLYQLKHLPKNASKGILAEENPDAKIEIGSWS